MLKKKIEKKYVRPTWDEYFLHLMKAVGERSTCDRGRPGCLIVKDRRVLATGYAGSPVGLPHCDDAGHQLRKMIDENGLTSEHCVRTIHAEMNAVAQAAKYGIPIDGATVYVKFEPCYTCAKVLVNCGIKRVVCEVLYQKGDDTRKLFKDCSVKMEIKDESKNNLEL